jgi:hypothetical protein
VAAYQRALRASLPEKAMLGNVQLILLFLWRIFTVGARVLALALFASSFGWPMFVVVGIHWFIMFIWIFMQNTTFCQTRLQELFFDMVAASVSIFDFFNLIEGHTRMRYLIYYILVYAENCVMVVLYYYANPYKSCWYVYTSMIAVLGLFFFGILIQLVYYLVYHPNNDRRNNKPPIKLCLNCRDLMNLSAN